MIEIELRKGGKKECLTEKIILNEEKAIKAAMRLIRTKQPFAITPTEQGFELNIEADIAKTMSIIS